MSQIMLMGRYSLLLFIVLFAVAGCGTPNDLAPFDSDAGKHASDWVYAKHAAVSNENSDSCVECHGSDLAGGISGVPCSQCHLNGSPYTLTGCTSCHGKPPTGNTAPNRSGAHSAHNTLPNVMNVCDTCHSGAGSGTAKHNNDVVDVAFLSVYNAKSGSAVSNSDGTCSKVSCHGGQTTPGWYSGTSINVNTQCTSCHAFGTLEYNGFSSGKHDAHVNVESIVCNACHDTAKLSPSHFTHLDTSMMEGPASLTLITALSYSNGSCAAFCHEARAW